MACTLRPKRTEGDAVETQTVRAQAKWVRTSARKARLVAEHIRGRSVPEARAVLAFTQRAAAREIEKVLSSAVANAESRPDLHWHGDDLVVASVCRGRGPDAEALARPRARPRRPDQEAHLPHHRDARPEARPGAAARPQGEGSPATPRQPKAESRSRSAASPKAEAKPKREDPRRKSKKEAAE